MLNKIFPKLKKNLNKFKLLLHEVIDKKKHFMRTIYSTKLVYGQNLEIIVGKQIPLF